MVDSIALVRHKLTRARELFSPRFAQWLLLTTLAPNRLQRTRLAGMRIEYLPQGNVARDLFLGQWEPDVVDYLRRTVQPGMTVLDIGANIGIYTLICAKQVGAGGVVHSFEPTPATFARLERNVALNRLANVHINQVALSNQEGVTEFHLYHQNAMNSLARQAWVGKVKAVVPVRTRTLDGYVAEEGITRVDLVKLDVEGAERMVLRGGSALLQSETAPALLVEFADRTTEAFGYRAAELRDLLEAHGYTLYRWNFRQHRLEPEPRRADYTLYANLIGLKNRA